MAIDVGDLSDNYDSQTSAGYSLMSRGNPANATGTINHIEIYMNDVTGGTSVTVYALTEVVANEFDSGANSGALTVEVGANTFDAPGDFTAFAITEGDFIGCYAEGKVDRNTSGGSDVLYDFGDDFPMDNKTFASTYDGDMLALYATGTEEAGDVTVTPDAIAITAGVQAPTINYDYVVAIGSALALTGTLNAPTVSIDYIIAVESLALTLALQDPEVGMFDGDYEEEQRPDTDFTELTKPTTSHTELEKPTTTHTELSSNLTEYTSIKWFGGYGSASYGNSPYGGAYGEYTEESKPSSDYTELTKPTTVYTEE